jgi:hypothetical protein
LGFWPGNNPNRTEPPAKNRTAGWLPGLVANTTREFMGKLHHSLLGMSWSKIWRMIEVLVKLRSAMQFRMMFLDFNEVNFGKLRLIVNVLFQVRYTSTAAISLRRVRSPLHGAHFIFV